MQPGWVSTLTRAGRRVIALDDRGHGQSDQALRSGRLSHRPDGGGRRALMDHLAHRRAPTSWATRWARGSRPSSRVEHPERVRSAILGGLGKPAGRRRRPAGVASPRRWKRRRSPTSPIRRAACSAPSPTRPSRIAGRSPPASAARARRCRASRSARSHVPVLIAVGTKDDVAGSPEELAAMIPDAHGARHPEPRSHARGRRQGVQGGRRCNSSRSGHDDRHESSPSPRRSPVRPATARGRCLRRRRQTVRRCCCCTAAARPGMPGARPPQIIVELGRTAYAVDQRGHGDSEWVEDGAYDFPAFAADARALADTLAQQHGVRPVAVGASLGGIGSMLAAGGVEQAPKQHGVLGAGAGRHHAAGRSSTASPRSTASCASTPTRASPRSRRRPTRSPPTCRTGRGRAPTRA